MQTTLGPVGRVMGGSWRGAWGASPWPVGGGTAWEDRGEVGVGRAFLRTLREGIVSPMRLLAAVRRPEGRDAVGLVLMYGLFWGISVVVHAALLLAQDRRAGDVQVIDGDFWRAAGVAAVGAVALAVPGFALAARTFGRLVRFDMPDQASPARVYSVLAYCLGPSVVAPLPYLGPVLALGWIAGLWVTAARRWLRASTAGAVIATVLTLLATVVAAYAVYWVGALVYVHLVGSPVEVIDVVKLRHG